MSLRSTAAETTKAALTTVMVPLQRKRAAALATHRPVRLHLGSAANRLDGWVNVDLFRPGRRLDLYWDLRRGIPFPAGAVDAIFSEHLFEHLTLDQGVDLMRECRRVLAPGGVLRIGVPDLERYVASYLGQDDLIEVVWPGRPTRATGFGEVFFVDGHRTMYDFETLEYALKRSGFVTVERSESGAGRIQPSPDTAARKPETLYVEAIMRPLDGGAS